MPLGEIQLLAILPPSQAASPQMLAIAMRNVARARANPIERTRGSVKRNLVDSSAAGTCNSKAELVTVRVGIGLNRITRGFGSRGLDDGCATLDCVLCHDL